MHVRQQVRVQEAGEAVISPQDDSTYLVCPVLGKKKIQVCLRLSLTVSISTDAGSPVAIEALEPYRRAPHSARPGATKAWNSVVCAMTWALRLTTAKAESAHRTEHAKLKDVTMLCKNAWPSPPVSDATVDTRSTCRSRRIEQGSKKMNQCKICVFRLFCK